jgi:hypothetical protein
MSRRLLLTVALALPALLGAGALVIVEGWWLVKPDAAIFTPAPPQTLAEAIDGQDLQWTYGYFVAGHHVEEPIDVQHGILTGGQLLRVSPLVWSVAVHNTGGVQLLLSLGGRLDGPAERYTPCLAEAVGDQALATLLRRYGADPGGDCDAVPRGAAPLIAFLAATHAPGTRDTAPLPR